MSLRLSTLIKLAMEISIHAEAQIILSVFDKKHQKMISYASEDLDLFENCIRFERYEDRFYYFLYQNGKCPSGYQEVQISDNYWLKPAPRPMDARLD